MITTIKSIFIKLLVIMMLSSLLSGCLLMMVTGPAKFDNQKPNYQKQKPNYQKQQHQKVHKGQKEKHPAIRTYTMRGFLDVFSTGMNTLATKIHQQLGMQATTLSY